LETRARLFDAALAEIGRCGLAGADVSSIASAAGVVRGTFYFHFSTKEHVLVELERNEEARIVTELNLAQTETDDLVSVLSQLVRRVVAAERQLGPVVFRDMLGLHFSATRPAEDELSEHPLAEFVIAAITDAQNAGRVPSEADARELGVFFMTGLFALLATGTQDSTTADAIMDRYVVTIVKGMEIR
jgi:AcrR family transcriptional regulator